MTGSREGRAGPRGHRGGRRAWDGQHETVGLAGSKTHRTLGVKIQILNFGNSDREPRDKCFECVEMEK